VRKVVVIFYTGTWISWPGNVQRIWTGVWVGFSVKLVIVFVLEYNNNLKFVFHGIHGIWCLLRTVLFGTIWTKCSYLRDEICKRHLFCRTYFGNRPTLVICDADIIKQITVKQFDKFTNRAVS